MNEYEMNWQADSAKAELELLKSKVAAFKAFLSDPVTRSFYIIDGVVRPKFDELFEM